MSSGGDKLEVHQGADGLWYWHRKAAGNHEIISQGEGYEGKFSATTGALRANPDLRPESVHLVKQPEENGA